MWFRSPKRHDGHRVTENAPQTARARTRSYSAHPSAVTTNLPILVGKSTPDERAQKQKSLPSALLCALIRAQEAMRDHPKIADPFAQWFITPSGLPDHLLRTHTGVSPTTQRTQRIPRAGGNETGSNDTNESSLRTTPTSDNESASWAPNGAWFPMAPSPLAVLLRHPLGLRTSTPGELGHHPALPPVRRLDTMPLLQRPVAGALRSAQEPPVLQLGHLGAGRQSLSWVLRRLRLGVLTRAALIDQLVLRLLSTGQAQRVVCLGAGYDMRPYRLAFPGACEWIEVDLPGVALHKQAILSTLSTPHPSCPVQRYALDLADAAARAALWRTLFAQEPLLTSPTSSVSHAAAGDASGHQEDRPFPERSPTQGTYPTHRANRAHRASRVHRTGETRRSIEIGGQQENALEIHGPQPHRAHSSLHAPRRRTQHAELHAVRSSSTLILTEGLLTELDPMLRASVIDELSRMPGVDWWVTDTGAPRTTTMLQATLHAGALHARPGEDRQGERNDPSDTPAQRNPTRSEEPGGTDDSLLPFSRRGWRTHERWSVFAAACDLGLASSRLRLLYHACQWLPNPLRATILEQWQRQASIVVLHLAATT